MPIQRIICNPPISIARLGESSVPLDAFSWIASEDPHVIGETQIKPQWTLDIQDDGSVIPRMPDRIVLKDSGQLRPVAPFIELWCDVGNDGDEDNWQRQPLTTSVLTAHGLNNANITFEISAMNLKVARRTGDPNHRYGTISPMQIRGDQHTPFTIHAGSLITNAAAIPMIPVDRSIALGRVQVIRPGIQPPDNAGVTWADDVNIETIRIRITPATGEFYGPPGSEQTVLPTSRSRGFSAVKAGNSFLNAAAGWAGATTERVTVRLGEPPSGLVSPGDTYDGAEQSGGNDPSLGIIDDTCEISLSVSIDQNSIGRPALTSTATVFCGPPDYSPDRRPFVSLADSFNDRSGTKDQRNLSITDDELDRWVEDLFERTYETVSLFNVDLWRASFATSLSASQQRASQIPNDQTVAPTRAMGGFDALRDGNISLSAPSTNQPLPVSQRARERHRNLSDIVALKRFIRENPNRFEELIRPAFFVADNENPGATTMQMPPFMRNSNAQPLTLTQWQYELLMEWQRRVLTGPVLVEEEALMPQTLSPAAEQRRARVLEQLNSATDPI